jgi:putative signal transducing protein
MQLIPIRTFTNYITASMLLSRLQNAGLECYLKDEYTVTIDPLLSNAIGGIKLVVRSEDLEKAKKLLQDFDDEYLQLIKCPQCGEHQFSYITKPGAANFLTTILTRLFSSYTIEPVHVYHCGNCSYETKTLPEPDYSEE